MIISLIIVIFVMPLYDKVGAEYAEMIKVEPVKVYAQRPGLIELLNPSKNELILDVGCGDGTITRLVAGAGACVVGYDISEKQIDLARNSTPSKLRINYFVSSPQEFSYPQKFDKAFMVMVLMYSSNRETLQAFFDSIYSLLKSGGLFVVLDCVTDKMIYGEKRFDRTFEKLGGSKAKLTFDVPGTKKFSVIVDLFSRKELEACAKKSGFKKIIWKDLLPSKEGIKTLGEDYWAEFIKSNPWQWLILEK
jgi:SAM-dependent methyltransferase